MDQTVLLSTDQTIAILNKVKYGSDGTFVQSRHHRQTSSVCCTEGRQAVEMTLKEIFFEIIIFIGYRTYEKT